MSSLAIHTLIPLKTRPGFRAKTARKSLTVCVRLDNSGNGNNQQQGPQQQQLNLSVLRFTFGIPGLDESYLPRFIGYGFGSLLLLNHFVGSYSETTPAQLRTEALGLSLAAFSIALPYFGRFLKGTALVDKATLPQGVEQIFVMSENISDGSKEDLAWATYVLLSNTNTIAVLISVHGKLCVRGYWATPDNFSKSQLIDWFERQIDSIGFSDLTEALYYPQNADSGNWEMLPNGTRSLLLEPVIQAKGQSTNEVGTSEGFLLLISSTEYAYSDKDRAWIRAVANKFREAAWTSGENFQ